VPIRVHSWFKTIPHSCPFVVPNHRSRRGHLGAQTPCGSAGASPSRYGHKSGTSSPQAACAAPAPSRSRLAVDSVGRGAWSGIAPWPAWKPRVPSPLTPGPSPLPGARGAMCLPGRDLGLKPELHGRQLIYVQPLISFVSIRVHSWFKTTPHSCPFVSIRGLKPSPHSCPFVSIRGLKPSLHSCPFVFIRGLKPPLIRAHSCSFVVQNHPLHSCPFVVPNRPSAFIRGSPPGLQAPGVATRCVAADCRPRGPDGLSRPEGFKDVTGIQDTSRKISRTKTQILFPPACVLPEDFRSWFRNAFPPSGVLMSVHWDDSNGKETSGS
jgi:hypothetical protein